MHCLRNTCEKIRETEMKLASAECEKLNCLISPSETEGLYSKEIWECRKLINKSLEELLIFFSVIEDTNQLDTHTKYDDVQVSCSCKLRARCSEDYALKDGLKHVDKQSTLKSRSHEKNGWCVCQRHHKSDKNRLSVHDKSLHTKISETARRCNRTQFSHLHGDIEQTRRSRKHDSREFELFETLDPKNDYKKSIQNSEDLSEIELDLENISKQLKILRFRQLQDAFLDCFDEPKMNNVPSIEQYMQNLCNEILEKIEISVSATNTSNEQSNVGYEKENLEPIEIREPVTNALNEKENVSLKKENLEPIAMRGPVTNTPNEEENVVSIDIQEERVINAYGVQDNASFQGKNLEQVNSRFEKESLGTSESRRPIIDPSNIKSNEGVAKKGNNDLPAHSISGINKNTRSRASNEVSAIANILSKVGETSNVQDLYVSDGFNTSSEEYMEANSAFLNSLINNKDKGHLDENNLGGFLDLNDPNIFNTVHLKGCNCLASKNRVPSQKNPERKHSIGYSHDVKDDVNVIPNVNAKLDVEAQKRYDSDRGISKSSVKTNTKYKEVVDVDQQTANDFINSNRSSEINSLCYKTRLNTSKDFAQSPESIASIGISHAAKSEENFDFFTKEKAKFDVDAQAKVDANLQTSESVEIAALIRRSVKDVNNPTDNRNEDEEKENSESNKMKEKKEKRRKRDPQKKTTVKPRKPEKTHPLHENSTMALYMYQIRKFSKNSRITFIPFKIYKLGERGSGIRAQGAVQDFYELRDYHLSEGILFEDKEFPADNSSLYYSKNPDRYYEWKRPHEIVDNPQLFVEGYSRFDVQQGELGDCWLLAAVANLTLYRRLFFQIVPDDQGFDEKYAGIFHFRFWQYGRWIDVVIDDRLPTYRGQLIFLHSTEDNEFWSALLEKAYAKLHGSYEALKGGSTCEAMEDFTGGVTEMYEMESSPPNLFKILLKAYERSSLMGCSIEPDPHVLEAETPEGLIRGHAYSITRVKYVDIQTPNTVGKIPLLRLRNPWGNETEWNGPWSDKSPEWRFISDHEKDELGLTFDDDGEFWMSFKDFQKHFSRVEICNLNPDSLTEEEMREGNKKQWEMSVFEGEWVRGCTAGGCRNFLDTFAHNPQYRITLTEVDEDDDENKCTVIIALMQKNRRSQRNMGRDVLTIGFAIYYLPYPDRVPKPLDRDFFKYNASVARSPSFINLREVSCRFKLPPGTYCIVPSTFDPNEEGEFLLRVFSENKNNMEENDEEIGYGKIDKRIATQLEAVKEQEPTSEEQEETDKVYAYFLKLAGDDMEVDWMELKDILDYAMRSEISIDKKNVGGLETTPGEGQSTGDGLLMTLLGLICGAVCKETRLAELIPAPTNAPVTMAFREMENQEFSKDICRSMVAMLDADRSGKLGYQEFKKLWYDLRDWKLAFNLHDKDKTKTLSGYELKETLNSAGYRLNNHILNILMHRYGNKNSEIKYDDFLMCAIKLRCMMEIFKDKDVNNTNSVNFTLEDWLERTLYA